MSSKEAGHCVIVFQPTLRLLRGTCCYSRGGQGNLQVRGEGSQTCDRVHEGSSLLTALRQLVKALTTPVHS
jgi:hypothetical protein